MKLKLKTVGIAVTGIVLLAIIGGETYYIVNSKKDIKDLTKESTELKSNLSQISSSLKEKEDKLDSIQDILNGKTKQNTIKEETITDKEEKQNKNNSNKEMDDVVGIYESTVKFTNNSKAQENSLYSHLELADDGTYHYKQYTYAEAGEYGNWYIDENGDIILNMLFMHSSDAALRMSDDEVVKKIKINNDGTLTDANKKYKGGELDDLSKIVLKKTSNKTDFGLHNRIKRYRDAARHDGNEFLTIYGD